MNKDRAAKHVLVCCWYLLDYIYTQYYVISDEKGTQNAAGTKGQGIK